MYRILIHTFLLAVLRQSTLATHDNVLEFSVFCQLIRLAESDVKLPVTNPKGTAIRVELDKVSLLSNLSAENFTEANMKQLDLPESLAKWLHSHPPPSDMGARRKFLDKIKPIAKSASTLSQEIRDENQKLVRERDTAQTSLARVLYGSLVDGKTYDGVRGIISSPATTLTGQAAKVLESETGADESCGGTGNSATGKTLINDFYCVCVGHSGKGITQACHNGLTLGSSWGDAGVGGNQNGLQASWPVVKELCPSFKTELSAEAIAAALAAFHTLRGRDVNTKSNDHVSYIVGKHAGNPTARACPYDTSSSCVNYKHVFTGGDKKGIPWENQFLIAAEKLREMKRSELRLDALMDNAHHLLASFEALLIQLSVRDPVGARPPISNQSIGAAAAGSKEATPETKSLEKHDSAAGGSKLVVSLTCILLVKV